MHIPKTIVVALISAALAAAVFSGAGIGGGAPQQGVAAVAVIDLSKALSEHQGLADQQAELEQKARSSQDELDGMRAELEQLRGELFVYTRGSPDYRAKEFEIERKKLEFEQKGRNLQYGLDKEKADILKAACLDVEKTASLYANDHGLDLVLSAPFSIEQVQTADPNDILKWLTEVNVIWSSDALDITDAVITIVNGP
jgi:Skp family chaperone for outer membrane proteins